ncbi:MAG: nascent polypeptide-associated complex protein [Candidatus Woesearchaeota archaeon]
MRIDPKLFSQAISKLGIKQFELQANRVVITCPNKEIVINNPKVLRIESPVGESFQIMGSIEERPVEAKISEEDVRSVSEHTGVDAETARKALEKNKGDIAAAILELQKEGQS